MKLTRFGWVVATALLLGAAGVADAARGGGGGGGWGGGGGHGGGGGWHGGGGGWHGGGGGWHGGGGHGGWHGSSWHGGGHWHGSVGVVVGPGWWGWPYYGWPYYGYGWPYYDYGYYGYPAYTPAPADSYYFEQAPQGSSSTAPTYWYYCSDPAGYYPYVGTCNQPWTRVTPTDQPDTAPRPAPR